MPGLRMALIALGILTPAAVSAATITVTSLLDNSVVDGQVTLREAITAANTDTSVDGSVPGNGPVSVSSRRQSHNRGTERLQKEEE